MCGLITFLKFLSMEPLMCRHCDDYMEEVRPGTGREAGLGHAGGSVKLPLLLTPRTYIRVGDAGAVTGARSTAAIQPPSLRGTQ